MARTLLKHRWSAPASSWDAPTDFQPKVLPSTPSLAAQLQASSTNVSWSTLLAFFVCCTVILALIGSLLYHHRSSFSQLWSRFRILFAGPLANLSTATNPTDLEQQSLDDTASNSDTSSIASVMSSVSRALLASGHEFAQLGAWIRDSAVSLAPSLDERHLAP